MKKTTIGTRLVCSFGAMGVAVALFAITCWQITGKLTGELDKAVNGMARKQFLAGQISTAASDMTSLERGVAFATVLQQAEKARALKAQVEDRQVQVRETLKEFAGLADTPVLRQALSDLERETGDASRAHVELGRLLDAGQMDLGLKHFDDVMLPRLSAVSERAKRIVEEERQRLADVAQTASVTSNRSRMVTLGLIGFCIVALAGVLVEIRRTTRRLRAITSEMSASASRVSGASEQVSSLSRTLADGAARQAASLEETSASSHETSSLTASNAERANQVASLMREVDGRIECANRTLEQMIASMRDIKASGEKIARIIKVIDEISFQTNILALNAAVEAARAGEAGMGFAVVADEVRNLAQRCAQAAKDTSELIEDSIHTSGEGAARIDEMAAAVRDITSRASDAKQLVEDVNTGSQEQARGIDHIARTLASMEQVTQQTAASAEEGAASAAALSSESTRMTAVVEELVGLVG